MPGKRIAIAGAFGFYNTGDDALLQSWLDELRAAEPNLEIIVLGGGAAAIREQFEVEAVDWSNWQRTVEIVESADLLLIGGGGLFHDYWAMGSATFMMPPKTTGPMYYINLIYLARLLGKPCVLSGVGVGPLTTETGRTFTRYAFTAATQATLRDHGSVQSLQKTGFAEPGLLVTCDPVFRLQPSRLATHQWQQWIGSDPTGPIFGISVRNWGTGVDRDRWMNQLVKALDLLLEQTGGTAVFLPFQAYPVNPFTDDVTVAREIRDQLKPGNRAHLIERYLSPDLAEAMIGSCDVIIGMRLHSIIMACRRARPVVALAYDPKVTNAMDELGLSQFCIPLASLSSETLVRVTTDCLAQHSSIATQLQRAATESAARGRADVRNVLDILTGNFSLTPLLSPPLQAWAPHMVKELGRLENELVANREAAASVERDKQKTIELHKDHLKSLAERADSWGAQQQAQLQRIERELQQLKSHLRHPLSSALKLLRLKAGTFSRRVFSRLRRLDDSMPAPETGQGFSVPRRSKIKNSLPSNRVCIVAPAFFDMAGEVPYLGGAERYLFELARVIRGLGYRVEIYQPAQGDWVREFRDLTIQGLDTGGKIDDMNKVFHSRIQPPALTVYLGFYLAEPHCFQPSIGISHGIYWDSEHFHYSHDQLRETIRRVTSSFANLSTVVSVDTNTINWLRTVSWPLAKKVRYLPNFVDPLQFHPRPAHFQRASGELVILYPRRMYQQRGFWLLAEVMPEILRRHPEVIFYFVGQAGAEGEREFIEGAMRDYPNRVRWEVLAPGQMHKAYWAADISVIPTVHAEGTSLSCLEAMASGNAVIASDVGGLPNLIIHNYNGLLIKPEVSDLRDALETLIQDAGLRARLVAKAIESAHSFNLVDWKSSWSRVLQTYLPTFPPTGITKAKLTTVIVEKGSARTTQVAGEPVA